MAESGRGTRIVVPYGAVATAKTRLAKRLSPEERAELSCVLLCHVIGIVRSTATDIVVVSPEIELRRRVEAAGAQFLLQSGPVGLNAGLELARRHAVADGVDALGVIHADLPRLEVADVRELLGATLASPKVVVIAPDRAGSGTNALFQRPADLLPFSFGRGSYSSHLRGARAANAVTRVVTRLGLACDIDTPADLAAYAATWLAAPHTPSAAHEQGRVSKGFPRRM